MMWSNSLPPHHLLKLIHSGRNGSVKLNQMLAVSGTQDRTKHRNCLGKRDLCTRQLHTGRIFKQRASPCLSAKDQINHIGLAYCSPTLSTVFSTIFLHSAPETAAAARLTAHDLRTAKHAGKFSEFKNLGLDKDQGALGTAFGNLYYLGIASILPVDYVFSLLLLVSFPLFTSYSHLTLKVTVSSLMTITPATKAAVFS